MTDDDRLVSVKTAEPYSQTVWEIRSLKSRCPQACTPSNSLEKNPFLPLPTSGGSRSCLASDCTAPISASIFTWLGSLWLCPPHPHPVRSHLKICNLLPSAKSLFQVRSSSQVPGVRKWTYCVFFFFLPFIICLVCFFVCLFLFIYWEFFYGYGGTSQPHFF